MKELIDSFGRLHTYLRISVTDRCNLRCIYCMPPSGIQWKERNEILTFEEIVYLAKLFIDLGIKKIRITGGEPTVRKDLEKLIYQLANLNGLETLAMTTNGIFLKDKAYVYKTCGLKSLNISLDTLKKERFEKITLRNDFNNVLEGIEASLGAGFNPIKLNVVVMKDINDDEILDFIEYVKNKNINVRFIEYMPFKDNGWDTSKFVSYKEIRMPIQNSYKLIPILNKPTEVAKDFQIPNFLGTVSFITSISDNFCGSCNRIRMTADGSLKSCLFYQPEINLRDLIRKGISEEALKDVIQSILLLKKEGHPKLPELTICDNQSMVQIGG